MHTKNQKVGYPDFRQVNISKKATNHPWNEEEAEEAERPEEAEEAEEAKETHDFSGQ